MAEHDGKIHESTSRTPTISAEGSNKLAFAAEAAAEEEEKLIPDTFSIASTPSAPSTSPTPPEPPRLVPENFFACYARGNISDITDYIKSIPTERLFGILSQKNEAGDNAFAFLIQNRTHPHYKDFVGLIAYCLANLPPESMYELLNEKSSSRRSAFMNCAGLDCQELIPVIFLYFMTKKRADLFAQLDLTRKPVTNIGTRLLAAGPLKNIAGSESLSEYEHMAGTGDIALRAQIKTTQMVLDDPRMARKLSEKEKDVLSSHINTLTASLAMTNLFHSMTRLIQLGWRGDERERKAYQPILRRIMTGSTITRGLATMLAQNLEPGEGAFSAYYVNLGAGGLDDPEARAGYASAYESIPALLPVCRAPKFWSIITSGIFENYEEFQENLTAAPEEVSGAEGGFHLTQPVMVPLLHYNKDEGGHLSYLVFLPKEPGDTSRKVSVQKRGNCWMRSTEEATNLIFEQQLGMDRRRAINIMLSEKLLTYASEIQDDKDDPIFLACLKAAQENQKRTAMRETNFLAANSEHFPMTVDYFIRLFHPSTTAENRKCLEQINREFVHEGAEAFDSIEAARASVLEMINHRFFDDALDEQKITEPFENLAQACGWAIEQKGQENWRNRLDFINIITGLKHRKPLLKIPE